MKIHEGKQHQPSALHEATIWYLRSMAKHLSTGERDELATWLRQSPEHASAFFLIRSVVSRAGPRPSTKRSALSHSYCKHVKQQSLYLKIALIVIAMCGVAGSMLLQDTRPLKIGAFAAGCFLLLVLRDAVVGFRVANGYFGSTKSEVRDFIKFITKHRGDINFTDQGGKRRTACNPESAPPAIPPPAESTRKGTASE